MSPPETGRREGVRGHRRTDERTRARDPGSLLPDPGHPRHHGRPPLHHGLSLRQEPPCRRRPPPGAPSPRDHPAAALQRDVRASSGCSTRSRRSTTRATGCEIQVLDDSTDETPRSPAARSDAAARAGFDIAVPPPHRPHRLQGRRARGRASQSAKGEFVADLRRRLRARARLPASARSRYFADPKVGMVQARWGHLNRDYSLLTEVQALLLDGHFIIEHAARNRSGRFFNFNGTAGIWRRAAIDDAGGWQHDTLTEDLDLSLPRAAAGLAVRLPARRRLAGRAAGRDERLQDAAAPLGQGLDPGRARSCCPRSSRRTCR